MKNRLRYGILEQTRDAGPGPTPPTPPASMFRFLTSEYTDLFVVDMDTSNGSLYWDMGDGSTFTSNDFSHAYDLPGFKTVDVCIGTTDGASSIEKIIMKDNDLHSVIDVSSAIGCKYFDFSYNSEVTGILNPSHSAPISRYIMSHCNLQNTLDLSGLSKLGGRVLLDNNHDLEGISFPVSNQSLSNLDFSNCNITGVLDASGLTGLSFYIIGNDNNNLTNFLFPETSNLVLITDFKNCDLTGTFDLSGLDGIASTLRLDNNPNLDEVLLPSSFIYNMNYVSCASCGLTTSSVDYIFERFNQHFSNQSPTGDFTIYMDGSTNASPTDGASNSDIQNLISVFDASGYDFNYWIN